jgi:hypothetical protein
MKRSRRRSRIQSALIGLGAIALFVPGLLTNVFGDGVGNWDPTSPAPRLELADWFGGDFQMDADAWFRERFGLRFLFVRLDNQLRWSFFSEMRGEGLVELVMGQDGHLIQWLYIDRYCGLIETADAERLSELATDLRRLQDALAARGIAFIFVISPNKVSVLPESMPDDGCPPHALHGPEYALAMPIIREAGIHHVDNFVAARRALGLHPEAGLFPRGASHWNRLAAFYGAEAILEKIDELVEQDVPGIRLDSYVVHNRPEGDDLDLARNMNLLWIEDDYVTAEPKISSMGEIERPLRVVVVGGSFMMLPLEIIAKTRNFEQIDYYFYYYQAFVDYLKGTYHTVRRAVDTDAIDWQGDIFQADVIILEANMADFFPAHMEPFTKAIFEALAEAG